jgi:parallel beta-helix repeat protein
VKIATLNYLVSGTSYDYITIDGIQFEGSISHALYFYGSATNIIIKNCTIKYAGGAGIYFHGGSYWDIDNNVIQHCTLAGCYAIATNSNITNNDISYIGMIPGSAFLAHSTGIFLNNTNMVVEYNKIQYTAWSGINTSSIASFTLKYNFINYPMQILDDGGGIYYTSSTGTRLIDHNIILNSGVNAPADVTIARGIYLDANSSGSSVTNNTVSGCREAGLHIHSGLNNTVTDNVFYNNGRQVIFQKITHPSTGIIFKNNKLISKTSAQQALLQWGYSTAEMQNWGTFDYNYYARPIDDNKVFYYASGNHTLDEWKTLMSQDTHSQKSPISISDIANLNFYYNASTTNKVISLTLPVRSMQQK